MPPDRVPCPHCDRTFPNGTRMEAHSRKAHGRGAGNPALRRALLAVGALAVVVVLAALVLNAPEPPSGREANLQALGVDGDPHLGNASAPVVVVEFASPRCPSCAYFHQELLPGFRERHVDTGNVVLYYQQFTIGYAEDEPGGIAQECVHREAGSSAFFAFTHELYETQGRWDARNLDDVLRSFAQERGLSGDALAACYRDRATQALYDEDVAKGRDNGVSGTPTFFVFGQDGEAVKTGAGELEDVVQDVLADQGAGR